jgi:hypothetical protein
MTKKIRRNRDGSIFHEGLMCFVLRVDYDYRCRTGAVHMEVDSCCHAPGCIALFEGIDPDVEMIATFAGGKRDMTYKKVRGEWESLMPA